MSEQGPTTHELSEAYRENFTRKLIDSGLMTKAFAESGILGEFGYDEETGSDALIHTLVGDSEGGAHHLPSIMAAGPDNVSVKSWIGPNGAGPLEDPADPPALVRPDWSYDKFKSRQTKKANGTQVVLGVITSDQTGEIFHKYNKGESFNPNAPTKTTLFPNEWTAEDIVNALVETKDTAESKKVHDARQSVAYKKTVDGVKLSTVVSQKSGKIITGHPE